MVNVSIFVSHSECDHSELNYASSLFDVTPFSLVDVN